ncbi:MAG: hypothetical protein NVS4B8_27300 [Herpetosiphon sp.]
MINERIYTYPRRWMLLIEILSLALIAWPALSLIRALAHLGMTEPHIRSAVMHLPGSLRDVALWLQANGQETRSASALIRPLAWLVPALIVIQSLSNLFPALRMSTQGLLVRWNGSWLPVSWAGIRTIRITEGRNNERFVVFVETEATVLSDWHRLYSLLYHFGWQPGFLLTSSLPGAGKLVEEIADTLEHLRMVTSFTTPIDGRPSPLFRWFVGSPVAPTRAALQPASAPTTAVSASGEDQIVVGYTGWLSSALFGVSILIGGLALWQYIRSWITFLYYQFPSLRTVTLQNIARGGVVWPVGVLIGAHLGLLVVVIVIRAVYHLFPTVSADRSGLTLSTMGHASRLGWNSVRLVKATSFDADTHMVLIEGEPRSLPWWYRIGPLAYDGGFGQGGIV